MEREEGALPLLCCLWQQFTSLHCWVASVLCTEEPTVQTRNTVEIIKCFELKYFLSIHQGLDACSLPIWPLRLKSRWTFLGRLVLLFLWRWHKRRGELAERGEDICLSFQDSAILFHIQCTVFHAHLQHKRVLAALYMRCDKTYGRCSHWKIFMTVRDMMSLIGLQIVPLVLISCADVAGSVSQIALKHVLSWFLLALGKRQKMHFGE